MNAKKFKIFSFYLPQFHPFPENDKFWGKGFTEWHNVTSAKPLFHNHYQPHLPTEMGFYDLRLPDTMRQQSQLAEEFGVDGFIFYHYWFNGKPLMEQPIDNYRKMDDGNLLPYFLCWANETWSRRWDGSEEEILIRHEYSQKDDEKHFDFYLDFFKDTKYSKINNCPVLAIYRPKDIPNLKQWTERINSLAQANGFNGVYLIYIVNLGKENGDNIPNTGFNAGLIFQPSWKGMPFGRKPVTFIDRVGNWMYRLKIKSKKPFRFRHEIINYPEYVQHDISTYKEFSFPMFHSVFPSWDNSARRKNGGGKIFVNSEPEEFKKWLAYYYNRTSPFSKDENFLVVNAWNEWAEGNHLEPCKNWGREYLEKIKEIVGEG